MKKLAIIIVDYRSKNILGECLKSINNSILPAGWQKEILVIDNNQINRGFAKAVNIGIKKALSNGSEAVLLLNPDTVVEKKFLIPMLKNKADIVAPVIKFRRNCKDVYDYGGHVNLLPGRTWHHYNLKLKTIDYVSGCCMLIRRQVIKKIGLLDERYFLYFEDVDLCLRAKNAGFKIGVELEAQIFHKLKDPKQRSFFQNKHLWLSNYIFINKWVKLPARIIAYLFWIALGFKYFL